MDQSRGKLLALCLELRTELSLSYAKASFGELPTTPQAAGVHSCMASATQTKGFVLSLSVGRVQANDDSGLTVQAEAALAACTEALWTAIKQPARHRPTADQWLAGPHADRLRAIQEVALQRASPADTALALETLQVTP